MRRRPRPAPRRRSVHIWLLVLVLAATSWFAGCNLWGPMSPLKRVTPPPETGRLEEARETLHSFLEARLSSEDDTELFPYMTQDARNDYKGRPEMPLVGTADAPQLGYRIDRGSLVTPGEFGFSIAVQSAGMTQPAATNVREDLLIQVKEGTYRVTSARFLGKSAAGVQGTSIVWEKDSLSKVLLSMEELPAEFSPLGSGGVRFGVGKEGFSALAIRPDDGEIAFGTWGVHGLVGVVSTTEPKRLIPLDLYFEGQAKLLDYSPNGRYLAVEEAAPTGTSRVRVYQPSQKRLINLDIQNAFPPDRYQMNISRWEMDGKTLLIRVSGVSREAQADKIGVWAVNVETGEREKLII